MLPWTRKMWSQEQWNRLVNGLVGILRLRGCHDRAACEAAIGMALTNAEDDAAEDFPDAIAEEVCLRLVADVAQNLQRNGLCDQQVADGCLAFFRRELDLPLDDATVSSKEHSLHRLLLLAEQLTHEERTALELAAQGFTVVQIGQALWPDCLTSLTTPKARRLLLQAMSHLGRLVRAADLDPRHLARVRYSVWTAYHERG